MDLGQSPNYTHSRQPGGEVLNHSQWQILNPGGVRNQEFNALESRLEYRNVRVILLCELHAVQCAENDSCDRTVSHVVAPVIRKLSMYEEVARTNADAPAISPGWRGDHLAGDGRRLVGVLGTSA